MRKQAIRSGEVMAVVANRVWRRLGSAVAKDMAQMLLRAHLEGLENEQGHLGPNCSRQRGSDQSADRQRGCTGPEPLQRRPDMEEGACEPSVGDEENMGSFPVTEGLSDPIRPNIKNLPPSIERVCAAAATAPRALFPETGSPEPSLGIRVLLRPAS